MNIQTVITKEVFEKYVPSAKMPERNDSVYTRLQEQFRISYSQVVNLVVGSAVLETAEQNEQLKEDIIRLVCLQAFAQVIRSLDLVLTATGFGIVSTNTTAPASKVRVDALLEETRLAIAQCTDDVIRQLTGIKGWKDTPAAHGCINTLFWSVEMMKEFCWIPLTAENWQRAKGLAVTADGFLRKVVSDEYMEELLEKMRSNSLTGDDAIIVTKCNRFTGSFISGYEQDKRPSQKQLDDIMQHLETYSSRYPTYVSSEVYKGKHAERYQNKREDPTFFFM